MQTTEAQLWIESGLAAFEGKRLIVRIGFRALALQELGELLKFQRMLEEFGGFAHLFICQRVQVDTTTGDEEGAEDNGAGGRNQSVGRESEQQPLVVGDADRIENSGLEAGNVAADEGLHGFERIVERVRVGRGSGRHDENLNGCGFGATVENLVLVPLVAGFDVCAGLGRNISEFAVGGVGNGCAG